MGKNLPSIWFGSTLLTVGTGLLILLDYTSSMCVLFLSRRYFAVLNGPKRRTRGFSRDRSNWCGLFIPDSDSGSSGSDASEGHGYCDEWFYVPSVSHHFLCLIRENDKVFSVLGGAVGLAVGEAIIASVLPRRLAAIPNIASLGFGNNITVLNDNIDKVHLIPVCCYVFAPCRPLSFIPVQDVTLRDAVLHAWARSIAVIWMVATVFAGVALVLALFLREYSVDRKTVYSGEVKKSEKNRSTSSEGGPEESSGESP